MSITLDDKQLKVDDTKNILDQNLDKIKALNNNSFFSHEINNEIGRQFVYYMCNEYYLETLNNPEPCTNLMVNTLSKTLQKIKKIDEYVNRPLNKYEFNCLTRFMNDFREGKIRSEGNKELDKNSVGSYIREWKRFWKIYKIYEMKTNPKNFKEEFFEWGLNLKSPRIDKKYEDFKELRVDQVIDLANNLVKEEYKVRCLVSVNLMGRKCEIQNVRYKDIEFSKDNKIFIKLPKIKKHSTEKTSVELFTFVKKALIHYLEHNEFKQDDLVFPSREEAFAKNLKEVSEKLFKARINPKTLRKIGLAVADELGISRSDIERIGGWQVNSPVLAHYFNRKKKVKLNLDTDNKLNEALYSDVYAEFDKMKIETKNKDKEIELLRNDIENIKKTLFQDYKEQFKKEIMRELSK